MKAYPELKRHIELIEASVAFGSETIFWGHFLEDAGTQYPNISLFDPRETDMVSDNFAAWWCDFYSTLDAIYAAGLEGNEWLNEYLDDEDYLTRAKELLKEAKIMYFIATTKSGEAIYGTGKTLEDALTEAIDNGYSNKKEYHLAQEERGVSPFIVKPCTKRLYEYVIENGGCISWGEDRFGTADLDVTETYRAQCRLCGLVVDVYEYADGNRTTTCLECGREARFDLIR